MGLLGKLMFWKKEDEFGLDMPETKDFGKDFNIGGLTDDPLKSPSSSSFGAEKSPFGDDQSIGSSPQLGNTPFPTTSQNLPGTRSAGSSFNPSSSPQNQPWQSQSPQFSQSSTSAKDLELINSKLDTLRAMLQSIDQRLNTMEHTTAGDKQKSQRLW
jgi:hypothetical protein